MDYTLIRGKRRSLTVSIRGGKVTVKVPDFVSDAQIREFVDGKRGWIEKKLAEYQNKTAVLSDVIDGTNALYFGQKVPITLTDKVKRVCFCSGEVLVPVKYKDDVSRAVGSWYRRTAKDVLSHTLAAAAVRTGLSYTSFSLTNAAGKWGSCDKSGAVMLNWRLIMLDDGLIDYVIVHELSHTLHLDHSASFWAEVKKHRPTYAADRKRLKFYSVLTGLYR